MSAPGDPTLGAIVRQLPDWWRHERSYGLANWKWPGLLMALLVAIPLMVVTYRVYGWLVKRTRNQSVFKYCLTIVFPVFAALIPLGFLNFCIDYLTIRGAPLYIISFLAILTARATVPVVKRYSWRCGPFSILAMVIRVPGTRHRDSFSNPPAASIISKSRRSSSLRGYTRLGNE